MYGVVDYINSDKTIDIVNVNITLSPLLERELVSKTENEKGVSEKYRIKV